MAAVNAEDSMGVAVEVSSLEFNAEDEDIFVSVLFHFSYKLCHLQMQAIKEVLGELSSVGIYAEVPALLEEEEIYDVDKTTFPSAADIAITTIA
jgi:hypothetical protein